MSRRRQFGQLPPRYRFALNPSSEIRVARCPRCQALTYPRKFALLIHIEPDELRVFGKTCKYCSRCEFIICHQDELEAELTEHFARQRPAVVGNPYLVVGTVALKTWRAGLTQPKTMAEVLAQTADIKDYRQLDYDPGGWAPAEPVKGRPVAGRRAKRSG